MQFHHFAITVSDLDKSLELYRDLMGMEVEVEAEIPDSPESGDPIVTKHLIESCFGPGSRARMAYLTSPGGAILELQQPLNPPVVKTDKASFSYPHTGMHELAFHITDIDDWFDRVRDAGYQTQTDHVWTWRRDTWRSFLFHDPDGHFVQLVEDTEDPNGPHAR
jgi:catechol 2,3-dioxygenase-like lactoylglutathione lyase family enzyme